MQDSTTRYLNIRPVASALAGVAALFVVMIVSMGGTSAQPNLSGSARVVDGDTLDVAGKRVRLEGIDAPESAQSCARASEGTWKCGKAASDALREMIGRRRVECRSDGKDGYGRVLGICSVGGQEINAELVRQGYAWAFVKYSDSYVAQEAEARAQRKGIWQRKTEPAWDYRKHHWARAEQTAPEGCAIKGNVTKNGHIYHMPWSPWYGKVRIDPSKGERWFCSESEALAAGWRPVEVH